MSSKIDLSENVVADVPGTPASGKLSVYAKDDGNLYAKNDAGTETNLTSGGGGGAPVDARYITQTANGTLTNEQALSALATGVMKSTTGTGVVSIAAAADLNTTHGSQTANTVYSAPDGSAGNPSFRALVADDLPQLQWELITSTTLGVASATIDLLSIPATYKSLKLLMYARSSAAGLSQNLYLRFNNDTTAGNYGSSYVLSSGTGVSAAQDLGTVATATLSFMTTSASTANFFASFEITIPNYANTTNMKSAFTTNAIVAAVASANIFTIVSTGIWRSTSAINRITLLPAAGNLEAGTVVELYGLG